MRRLVQWLSQADTEVLLSRRALLARALVALVPEGGMTSALHFPQNPLKLGPMPLNATSGSDPWDGLASVTFYPGGINPFSVVPNPNGHGLAVRCENRLSYPTDTEAKHTTAGTKRDEQKDATVYFASTWLWPSLAEFTRKGWTLVEQLQAVGSPNHALSVDEQLLAWFMQTRDGTSARKYPLEPIQWNHWATCVVGSHLADKPNGWIEWWFRQGATAAWPDVSQPARGSRRGIAGWQGGPGKHTIGVYSEHGFTGSKIGMFGPLGRGATAAEAVAEAKKGAAVLGFLELAA